MPITSSSATESTFHKACTESYRHHLCCCWTWTSWCPPCGRPCAQRTHFQPKLLNRSRKHSSGGSQNPWSGLRVFLHRGPFSDSTQFWLKTKEQFVQAMVWLRKSTFDPADRQIHCWPSNTLVTVKQFRHVRMSVLKLRPALLMMVRELWQIWGMTRIAKFGLISAQFLP